MPWWTATPNSDCAPLTTLAIVNVTSMPGPGDLAPGFMAEEGRCWRMLYGTVTVGQGGHCPGEVRWRGRFTNDEGRRWTVWSCDEHRADLDQVQPWKRTLAPECQ